MFKDGGIAVFKRVSFGSWFDPSIQRIGSTGEESALPDQWLE